jgi:YD repeat-containing protein
VTSVYNTLSSTCGQGTPSLTLAYDANGNLASVTPQGGSPTTYTFDVENRLKTRGTAAGTVSYTYDGNGTMLKRTDADGSYTVYIGGVFERTFDAQGSPAARGLAAASIGVDGSEGDLEGMGVTAGSMLTTPFDFAQYSPTLRAIAVQASGFSLEVAIFQCAI